MTTTHTRIIDTTYTGPDQTYRTDARFQLDRALADMEMCRSLMIHGDATRIQPGGRGRRQPVGWLLGVFMTEIWRSKLMSINLYIDLLNGLLTRSGHAKADYATANYYYFAGVHVGDACSLIIRARQTATLSA